ncbi:MAG: sensor histidine kinase [Gammaproteobacteria bacterium]|nr:sensor histidine kinase [Gammaproteobacteria bacterium]
MQVTFLETGLDNRHKRRVLWLLVLIAFALALWRTENWNRETALANLQESSRQELRRYVLHLQGQLEKYEFLPGVLASNKPLVYLLQHPGDQERIVALNNYLETVNKLTGTSDTYLMDANGLTIASSNWATERPFVGRNFSYRPYFQQAMKGQLGRYFALGTTSNKRGYYFAYPVWWDNRILGAVVVKIDMAPIEESWKDTQHELLVSDPDGVVFITTNKGWRYKTLNPLAPEVLERIRKSRRYDNETLETLPITRIEARGENAQIVRINEGVGHEYLVQEESMSHAGWRVHILTRLDQVNRHVLNALVFAALFFLAFVLLVMFWMQRRHRFQEKAKFERKAKETLELRVREQTRDITEANIRLTQEIEQHRRTESELQRTQSELIQSAKLAVIGQLSTGISHELNQPLSAIRSYADNSLALHRRGRGEELEWNLAQISELTERMAQISSQLKLFARKAAVKKSPVSVTAVVEDSLRLLSSRLKKVRINWEPPKNSLYVLANMVQLEQVLVNLFSNALHAVDSSQDPLIAIEVKESSDAQSIHLAIRDNGEGIPDNLLERIFDPFFTTKEKGQGLGLGLSISMRIIDAMDGKIEARNHPEGGALFVLKLPTAHTSEEV